MVPVHALRKEAMMAQRFAVVFHRPYKVGFLRPPSAAT